MDIFSVKQRLMTHEKPTKRQKEILDYIVAYSRERGYAPSYREIAQELGMSSPATVHEHVKNLEVKGYLRSDGDAARSIEIEPVVSRVARAVCVPLAGLITAGEPIEAVQTNETVDIPETMSGDVSETYVLKVKGNSMIDDGIHSGDYVVVERNPAPRDGEIVVALLDNMYATLKRIYREKGRVRLQPANSAMKPIYAKNVVVQGVVRGLLRNYRPA